MDFVTQLESVVVSEDQERRLRMGQRVHFDVAFTTLEIAASMSAGVGGILHHE